MLSSRYLAWNTAIADSIYNSSCAGLPVYLDLDHEKFELIKSHTALDGLDLSKEGLAAAVLESINWDGNKNELLWPITGRSQRWLKDFTSDKSPSGAPPMVAFLAVAVIAAEAMGEGEFGPLNYYSQLHTLLGVTPGTPEAKKLEHAYRKDVLTMWALLKKWLVENEWSLGIPTAEALSHPYVSVAMSQALVRDADRKKLPRMFDSLNLRPGDQIAPNDMQDYLNIWLQQPDCAANASFKTLWERKSARERISEVVSKELEAWEGSVSADDSDSLRIEIQKKLRIFLKVRKYLGQKSLDLNLAINSNKEIGERSATCQLDEHPNRDFIFNQEGKNLALLANPSELSFDSALLGDLHFKNKEGLNPVRRLPGSVVALEFQEELQGYLEVTKAPLSRSIVILVRDDVNLLAGLQGLLSRNARPGFKDISADLLGLPAGWRLIGDVQLETSELGTFPDPFASLRPTVNSQLSLNGGVSIPGPMASKKFLNGYAPEVRATSQSQSNVSLHLYESKFVNDNLVEVEIAEWISNNGSVAVDLSSTLKDDGDYRVVFKENQTPTFQRDFFIRSARTPDLLALRNKPSLVHSFEEQECEAAFETIEYHDDMETYIFGGFANYTYPDSDSDSDSGRASNQHAVIWDTTSPELTSDSPKQKIGVQQLPEDSCVFTGRHIRHLDTPATNKTKFVRGVCVGREAIVGREAANGLEAIVARDAIVGCGAVTTEYCHDYQARKRELTNTRIASKSKNALDKVLVREVKSIDIAAAISLVYSAVHGKVRLLLRGLEVLAGEQMTALQLLELLEQLGHIEFTRDIQGYPDYWAIVDKQLIIRTSGMEHQLLGIWDKASLDELRLLGIQIKQEESVAATFDFELDFSELSSQIGSLGAELGSSSMLVDALPEFSFVRQTLDRLPLPAFEQIELFDLEAGKWSISEYVRPGAFRLLTTFGRRHFYASSDDLDEQKAVAGSATIVKYLAANEKGATLLNCSVDEELVTVPRGALVPGLYGRALVLDTGIPPIEISKKTGESTAKLMQYQNVDLEIAQKISRLLAE